MKKFVFAYIAPLLLLCSACLKDIPIDDNKLSDKAFVGCLLKEGEHPRLSLMKKIDFNSNYGPTLQALQQADVKLYKNGTLLSTLWRDTVNLGYGTTFTDTNIVAEAGASYRVTVNVPSLQIGIQSPDITVRTGITSSDAAITEFVPGAGKDMLRMTLPKEAGNSYILLYISTICIDPNAPPGFFGEQGVYPYYNETGLGFGESGESDFNYSNVKMGFHSGRQQVQTDSMSYDFMPAGFTFNTSEATDGEVKIAIRFAGFNEEYCEGGSTQVRVQIISVDKDYYDYVVSAQQYMANEGNPFSTPTQVYTNIQGGTGIFGVATYRQIILDL